MAPKLFLMACLLAAAAAGPVEDRYGKLAGFEINSGVTATGAAGVKAEAEAAATDLRRDASSDVVETNAGPRSEGMKEYAKEERGKRHARWVFTRELFQGYPYYKEQAVEINRPYVIPIYGVRGKYPIFFPPQPIYINPGMPPDNPMKQTAFMGPTYLPPKMEPVTSPSSTKNKTGIHNKSYGYDDFDDEDRPRWGVVQSDNQTGGGTDSQSRPPAAIRPPVAIRPPSNAMPQTESPPLIHDINDSSGTNKLTANEVEQEQKPPKQTVVRPQSTPRTTTTTTMRTTVRPAAAAAPVLPTPAPPAAAAGPSNCVWAVISCCSASSNDYPENCFEQRGCPGPFWDRSPCDSDFAKAAVDVALQYYGNRK